MIYGLIAFLVAFVSIFVPVFIGARITKKHSKNTIPFGAALSVIYFLILWMLFFTKSAGFYAPTPYFGSILFGSIISFLICYLSEGSIDYLIEPGWTKAAAIPIVLVAVTAVPMLFFGIFRSSDLWGNAPKKAALLGEVIEVADINEAINTTDTARVCLVDQEMAKIAAQNALSKFKTADGSIPGSRYTISNNPTKQLINGKLWWIFPVEFQGWLKWRQNPQVPGYLRVSAEDPYAEGEAVQENLEGKPIRIKYLNSACWEFLAERHLRYNGFLHTILMDWTFEPDDNWDPYYTVTICKRAFGYTGYVPVEVLALNLQTGAWEIYSLDKLPEWIDRAIPQDIIDTNVKKWGRYRLAGWWHNLWHDDKAQQPTPGWYLTHDKDHGAMWFSGMTSTSETDQAMTGFVMVNSQNMQTTFYKATGVTEEKAYDAARSLWSEKEGYEPAELVPYNLGYGLTYVVPIKYKGQFKGISLVSLSNVNVNGRGETMNQALAAYRNSYTKATESNRLVPRTGSIPFVRKQGLIERVGFPIVKGEDIIIPFTITGETKRFQVVDSRATAKAIFMKPGDVVSYAYLDSGEMIVTCQEIDIDQIQLTEENPDQERL